ncbi:unnamed protein product [Cunninghamella echinulata]
MEEKGHLSMHLIKAIRVATRSRTRELSMSILANLACHEDIRRALIKNNSILLLCQSLLRNENQAEILLETTRLLNAFFTYTTSFSPSSCSTFISKEVERQQQQTQQQKKQQKKQQQKKQQQLPKIFPSIIIKYNCLNSFLIDNDDLQYSIYHQYTQIIMNTLPSELLYASLQLLTSITIHIHGITLSLSPMSDHGDQNEKMEREKLINWAIERLNEETKGIVTEMKLNGDLTKLILCLVWTFLFFHLLENPSQYISNLDSSLSIITHHLQQKAEADKTSDDQDIEFILNALRNIFKQY